MPHQASAASASVAEDRAHLGRRPRVEQALVAVPVGTGRVGVLGRGEPACRLAQVAQHVADGLGDDLAPAVLAERDGGVGVDPHEQRLVVEHLLEVRDEPLAVDGVAGEAAADVVVHATRRHRVERCRDDLPQPRLAGAQEPVQQEVEAHRGRELRRRAEPAPLGIEALDQGLHGAVQGSGVGHVVRWGQRGGPGDRLAQRRAVLRDLDAAVRPRVGDGADGGRYVIRYDHRDTGRSVTYEPGSPGYTGDDLVADAAGVLDAYGIPAAHLVGVSAGGAFAQLLALDFADRVRSLVLISTSTAVPGDRELPPPTDEFSRFASTAQVDWSDADSVIEYLVGYSRVLAGGQRPFDETAARELARREVERARSFAAAQNHDAIPNGERSRAASPSINVPTLVIHGTADPMFPVGRGEALAAELPQARLLRLDRAGHGLDRSDWETVARAILEHTGAAATS